MAVWQTWCHMCWRQQMLINHLISGNWKWTSRWEAINRASVFRTSSLWLKLVMQGEKTQTNFTNVLTMGLILISDQCQGKQLLTAEPEHSYIRNPEAADKVDICAPVMPKGIPSVAKMEQQLPSEVKIIARNNFLISRVCRSVLSEFTSCFPVWICFSLCCWLGTLFPCERLYSTSLSAQFWKKNSPEAS